MAGIVRLNNVPDLVRSGDIRVWLDREALLSIDPEVTVTLGTAEEAAQEVWPPWFFVERELMRFGTPGARPYPMAEVVSRALLDEPRGRIPATPLAIPCYRTPAGAISLDANHRFHALARSHPSAPVVVLTIEGPLDRSILPDLAYWQ